MIHLSGHTHGALRDENNIWQGNFAAVKVTCLQVWQGDSVGISEPSKENYGACVIDVFADRIVFRRFVVREGAPGKVKSIPRRSSESTETATRGLEVPEVGG